MTPPPLWTAIPVGIVLGLVVAWACMKLADWWYRR
jgi:hypothetical protein